MRTDAHNAQNSAWFVDPGNKTVAPAYRVSYYFNMDLDIMQQIEHWNLKPIPSAVEIHGRYATGSARGAELYQRFVVNVRELRRTKGLSQAELAEKTGTHQPHISAMERGRRAPSFELIAAIAAALGVHPKDLFE